MEAAIAAIVLLVGALSAAVIKIMQQRNQDRKDDAITMTEEHKQIVEAWQGIVADLKKRDDYQQKQIDTLHKDHLDCQRHHIDCEKRVAVLTTKVESAEGKLVMMARKVTHVEQEVKEVGSRSFPPNGFGPPTPQ